jgi:hypothetical protein
MFYFSPGNLNGIEITVVVGVPKGRVTVCVQNVVNPL